MHRINDVRCAYLDIGSKLVSWEKSLSPRYTYCVSFLIYLFVRAATSASLHADIIYATDCTVIAWLSVSDSSAIFLAVCTVICGNGVFMFTTMTNPFRVHRFPEKLESFRFLTSLRGWSDWKLPVCWVTYLVTKNKSRIYLKAREKYTFENPFFFKREIYRTNNFIAWKHIRRVSANVTCKLKFASETV